MGQRSWTGLAILFPTDKVAAIKRGRKGMALIKSLLRIAYACWFIFWGLAPVHGVAPPPTTQPDALALLEANRATFAMDLASASFVVGGLALLIARTAPLGIVILAPTVVWIFLFHVTMTGDLLWGSAWLVGLGLLAWWHRAAFKPLVNWR